MFESLICFAGAISIDVEDGSLQQEPGSGIRGQVNGTFVAVGSMDWVCPNSEPSPSSEQPYHLSHNGVPALESPSSADRYKESQEASTSGKERGDLAPGHTAVYVSIDGRLAGVMHVADTIRPEAWETVQALRQRGLRVGLLSGECPHSPLFCMCKLL